LTAAGGGLTGQPQPARGEHATPRVDHPGHVGTVPNGLRRGLAKNPVLLSLTERIEVRPWVGSQIVGRVLDSRDMDAITLRVPLESCAVDRKSTRLNSSHVKISYAVFCLKKKKKNK